MYEQIFRHACGSGGTVELLANLIWVLSCKTAQFIIGAQRVTVLLDTLGADGRLTDTHGCAKTHPAPRRSHLLRSLSRDIGTGWGAEATGHRLDIG